MNNNLKMRLSILFLIFLSTFYNSQVLKDTILGKPKFVKEYVIFLNNSNPSIFMQGDSEYGHAVIMTPENLRKNMKRSWFESNFCRYINNETYYDKNRNITREIWYRKSGEILDDYRYKYDRFNRVIYALDSSDYSTTKRIFFYRKLEKEPIFEESVWYKKGEKPEKYGGFRNTFPEKHISEYDTIKKVENVYLITNKKNKFFDNGSYQEIRDSIFNRILTTQRYYDEKWRVIKSADFHTDYKGVTKYLGNYKTYEYDDFDRKIKKSSFREDKLSSYTLYEYDDKDVLTQRKSFSNIFSPDKLDSAIKFFYDKNYYIEKLEYTDNWGNTSDIYIWKREIQYY